MKLGKENMTIASIVIVKRLICIFCMTMIFLFNGYAQINELSIELEIVSVSKGDYRPSSQELIEGDTFPKRIVFEFIVYNNSNKILMIGSNTRYSYEPNEQETSYGEIGRFLMINGVDTIPLYTDAYYLYPSLHYSTRAIWGIIESSKDSKTHSVFTSFLNRWAGMDKCSIKGLYDYLKASRFVYVPILADYQKRLDEIRNKSIINSIIYPLNAIEVKKKRPFVIIVGFSEESEYDYIYPLEVIKQDE